jgi:hypothetical protein
MRTGTQVWLGAVSNGLNPSLPRSVDRFINLDDVLFARKAAASDLPALTITGSPYTADFGMSPSGLSTDQLRRALAIKEQIESLQAQLSALLRGGKSGKPARRRSRRQRRREAARGRSVAAGKARAKERRSKKTSAAYGPLGTAAGSAFTSKTVILSLNQGQPKPKPSRSGSAKK